MKLYMVHCGFYDPDTGGIYESHANVFVVAEDPDQARKNAKLHPLFKKKRMHIDGLVEVNRVAGWDITLSPSPSEQDDLRPIHFRSLAPQKDQEVTPVEA